MRVGIVGSRKVDDPEMVTAVMSELISNNEGKPLVFVGGGSKGSERIAQEYISQLGLDFVLFKPYNFIDVGADHHPKYFFYRNKQIVDNSDLVIVFLEDSESGVKKTLAYIKNESNKPYRVYGVTGALLDER